MKLFFSLLALTVSTAGFSAEFPALATKSTCCEAMHTGPLTKNSLYQMEVRFTADNGEAFNMEQLRGHPVVLALFFTSCGYACPLIVSDMLAIQTKLPLEIRQRTTFVLVSFDSQRDTPEALSRYRQQRDLGGQWTLLHGSPDAVRELAAVLGVKYKQEPDGAFSHTNLITILNDEGEIIHRREGLNGGIIEAVSALANLQKKR